jgi:RimJ/RimL family protein N-acetyltransferase
LRLLYGADEAVGAWVKARLPNMPRLPVPFVAIGVVDGAQLVAGVLFHNYIPEFGSIEVSIAADTPRWLSRNRVSLILGYPFRQLGCGRVSAAIMASNSRSIRLCMGLGFKREGLVRRGFGRDDAVILGLLREEWERGRYGNVS